MKHATKKENYTMSDFQSYTAPIQEAANQSEVRFEDTFDTGPETAGLLAEMSHAERSRFYEALEARAQYGINAKKEAEQDARIGESLRTAWDEIDRRAPSKGARYNERGELVPLYSATSYTHFDPSTAPVTIRGMSVQPEEAENLLAQGYISQVEFIQAVEETAAAMGNPGFRLHAMPNKDHFFNKLPRVARQQSKVERPDDHMFRRKVAAKRPSASAQRVSAKTMRSVQEWRASRAAR